MNTLAPQLSPDRSLLYFPGLPDTHHAPRTTLLPQLLLRPRKKFIEVTRGSVTVKVYLHGRWRDKRRHKQYRFHPIIYRELDPATGQFIRRREKRALKKDALDRADQIAIRLANGETAMLHWGQEKMARWQACEDLAASISRDPVVLISERVAFEKKRPVGVTDDDLISSWNKHHPAGIEERHIPKIVVEFLAKRIICDKYRRNLVTILERFAAKFDCPIGHLRPRDIEDWLDGLKHAPRTTHHAPRPIGLRTRHNHRAAVENLINFARDRGYLDHDWNALDQVTDPEPPAASVDLYTPEDLVKLLARAEMTKAGRKLVPLICITAFAGVRHGEMNEEKIEALDWANFDWEARKIYVDADAAKQTGRTEGDDRVVDMPANLVAWLAPYKRTSGKICALVNTSNALCRLRKKAGITGRRKNALRKSYITYKLALGENIDSVAGQAGNSPGVIRRSYRAARHTRLHDVAARWFAILPDRADRPDDPLFAWAKAKGK